MVEKARSGSLGEEATGFQQIDNILKSGGVKTGQLFVLAAANSGKSTVGAGTPSTPEVDGAEIRST